MATFDISRVSFNPLKHFKSVRMQQGRVLTDDDWNENERIENDDRRRTIVDIIGAYGTPDDGFAISNFSTTATGDLDFDIGPGTIYLGGLRLEIDGKESFQHQSDWLQKHDFPAPAGLAAGAESFNLVYLEAWQQPVCAVEDSELFETALGGPDTTTRLKNMRRVNIFTAKNAVDCPTYWRKLQDSWTADNLGTLGDNYERVPAVTLQVSFTGVKVTDNLCTPSLTGAYLGAENQAIRVQITDDPATHAKGFTWGLDDASPYYKVTVTGTTVKLQAPPKDQYHWPLSQQIVEILPLAAVLPNGENVAGLSGELKRVTVSYDPDLMTFTIDSAITTLDAAPFYFMRVWNRGSDVTSPIQIPIPAPGGTAVLGNTGLQVSFNGTDLVPDDYWVIAARPDTPDQIVPWALLNPGIAPQGVHRFYAPLGIIRWTGTGAATAATADLVYDCRRHFRPLTDQECCCTYTVGDGSYSRGDFNSIENAVAALPVNGGKICVLPGYHYANVQITGKNNVQIYGCGEQSVVRPHTDDRIADPIFFISASQSVSICHLTLVTIDGIAIDLEDSTDDQAVASSGIDIGHNRITAAIHAVRIAAANQVPGNNDIYIHHNLIAMLNLAIGKAGIFSRADDVLIERNRLVIIRAQGGGGDQTPPGGPGGWTDPCCNRKRFYGRITDFQKSIRMIFDYALLYRGFVAAFKYLAQGGIQIAGTSEQVQVLENTVIGGWGHGITLGDLPEVGDLQGNAGKPEDTVKLVKIGLFDLQEIPSVLYKISIEENNIQQMGSSGIGVVAFSTVNKKSFTVTVFDLEIFRNQISQCALPNSEFPDGVLAMEHILGGITLAAVYGGIIQNNRIEQNGAGNDRPTVGLVISVGTGLDISNNQVIGNGVSGGIWIGLALTTALLPSLAVRIHQNVVFQPAGKALKLIALGPVSVVANQFCSQGLNQLLDETDTGSTVSIMNLGVSRDMLNHLADSSFLKMGNIPLESVGNVRNNPKDQRLLLPNGKILFTDNQVTLDFQGKAAASAMSSVTILTFGDLGFNDNQLEYKTVLPQKEQISFDALLVGSTVRSNDNRFEESTNTHPLASLFSLGVMNIATGNTSTYCLFVIGTKRINQQNLVWTSSTEGCKTRQNGENNLAKLLGAEMVES